MVETLLAGAVAMVVAAALDIRIGPDFLGSFRQLGSFSFVDLIDKVVSSLLI
ncbi:MAG: hypothetical protein HQL56_17465 [Magnetococcales bacterium]|nr:hypothetical protein [Magnetococcales bacterium]